MRRAIAAFGILVLATFALAQQPVTDAVRNQLQRAERNITGAAEEMPADKYNFKPTAQQMTFAHLMGHIAGSNDFLCSSISGLPKPQNEVKDTDGKDKLVDALKQSFAFCRQALEKVDDSKLGENVPLFGGRTVTRAAALIALSNDWADHYSAAASYLRLNGMLPPSANRAPGQASRAQQKE
jgi:uncharacterized damage-inducible protein DinB